MKSRYFFRPASLAHCGSRTSFMYVLEIMPTEWSRPAGSSTVWIDADGRAKTCVGLQLSSAAFRIACAANLGVVALKKTVAFDEARVAICESIVGLVGS